jgi:hypothetical protein
MQLVEKKSDKVWVIVTDASGLPLVHEIGDYLFSDVDPLLFLYTESNKDKFPLVIYNMTTIISVEFLKEKPEVISVEEFQKATEEAKEAE